MIKLYLFSKSVHRILLLIIITLGLLMGVTGTMLKYPSLAQMLSLNSSLIRILHNQLSPWFTIVFILMALTGIIMYIFPLLRKK